MLFDMITFVCVSRSLARLGVISIGGVAIAIGASSASAQAQSTVGIQQVTTRETTLTKEQLAEFESWDDERQARYTSWSPDIKAYYWTLDAWQKPLFWQISDHARRLLVDADDMERQVIWHNIDKTLVVGVR